MRTRVVTWRKRGAWLTLAVLIVASTSCGANSGSAKTAVRNAVNDAGFEDVAAVKGSLEDDSGQLTVHLKEGEKIVLDVVQEGGEILIENCADTLLETTPCQNLPIGQPLEP